MTTGIPVGLGVRLGAGAGGSAEPSSQEGSERQDQNLEWGPGLVYVSGNCLSMFSLQRDISDFQKSGLFFHISMRSLLFGDKIKSQRDEKAAYSRNNRYIFNRGGKSDHCNLP